MATFHEQWLTWHRGRITTVTAPHGVASLASTTWLAAEPTAVHVAGEPQSWRSRDGRAVRDDHLTIAPGHDHREGELLLRAIERAGIVGLRVFNPSAATRTLLTDISTFEPNPKWVVEGRFARSIDSTLPIERIDGHRSDDVISGTITLSYEGHDVSLVTFPGAGDSNWFVFADTTNGKSTKQFRFLSVDAPDSDGTVQVDFNRAYLPPCAFSDHYLCPLPPPSNRLVFPVEAGETFPIHSNG